MLTVLGHAADLESAGFFLGSGIFYFTELGALVVLAFWALLEDWATSSVMSKNFGLGDFLGLGGLEFFLFSLGRICKIFVFGASTFFLV